MNSDVRDHTIYFSRAQTEEHVSVNPAPKRSNFRSSYFFRACTVCVFRWTPRCCAAYYSGIYGLGYAYKNGIMYRIHLKAMHEVYLRWGYAGVGAFQPRIDWGTAWGVQAVCTIIGGVLYDIIERICLYLYGKVFVGNRQVE